MVSTPERFTDDSPISTKSKSTSVKKPRDQKSLCLFTNILEVEKLITVELELLNIIARQLNLEIYHGH